MSWLRRAGVAHACALVFSACPKEVVEEPAQCGLHSASAFVYVLAPEGKRVLPVGARVRASDTVLSTGEALLECFGGALLPMHAGDKVLVKSIPDLNVEGAGLPRHVLRDNKLMRWTGPQRIVAARYLNIWSTPPSAQEPPPPTTSDYFMAFFSPNGIENLTQTGPKPDGPRQLPAPPKRQSILHVHAGPLGSGGPHLTPTGQAAFAETDGLTTAVLLPKVTVDLGQTTRLILPAGTTAYLELSPHDAFELSGPTDLRLK